MNSYKDENEFTEPFNFDIVMNALSNGKEIQMTNLKNIQFKQGRYIIIVIKQKKDNSNKIE